MNNLATTNNKDFTVLETGDAYISQRKIEELLGVSDGTVRKHLSRHHKEYNTINGLDSNMLETVTTYYAFDTANPTQKAKDFAKLLMKAGSKAYIYHEAGYKMDAKPSVPMTYLEALKELVATQELLEAAKPAIAFHGQLYAQNRAISINEYAKLLSDTHECIIGPNKLMDFLRKEKILMKGRDRHEKNMPYQKYLNCKWFEVEYHQTTVGLMATPMILPLGQTMLAEKILDHFKI